jgi:CRP-like cAMP-binding protein
MENPITTADLQILPFFNKINEEVLTSLLDRHRVSSLGNGQTLLMEGDWDESLIVILNGLVKVRTFNADGEETVFALLGAGDLLGEMSILDGQSRSADVMTLSPVTLLKLQGKGFRQQLHTETSLALQLARLEAARLRDLNRRFLIQRSDSTTRVLHTLSYLACKSSAKADPLAMIPPLPQGEIAILAGLARETASRVMSKLRAKGVVIEHEGSTRLASLDPLTKRGLWP